MIKFSIEDEVHAEWQGDYPSLDLAVAELRRRASIPWDQEPNKCPCTGWKHCERIYVIQKYDLADKSWTPLEEIEALSISSNGTKWLENFGGENANT